MDVTPAALTGAVAEAVAAAPADGGLGMPAPPDLALRPVAEGDGDFICALPARLAAQADRPVDEVAATLAAHLRQVLGIAGVTAGDQGILVIAVEDTVGLAAAIAAVGESYGFSDALEGAQLTAVRSCPEQLAAAPTKDAAARLVKDEALGRIAEAAGAEVTWTTHADTGTPLGGDGLADLVAWGDEPALRYVLVRTPEASSPGPRSGARAGRVGGRDRGVGPRGEGRALVARCRRVWGEPAFEVRYACAHMTMTLRNAKDLGVDPHEAKPGRFTGPLERSVLKAVFELPDMVARAARRRDVTVLTRHLETTAAAYQRLADTGRVLPRGQEPVTDMHRSRVLLTAAVRTTMAAGLAMLGVAVPDRM